MKTNLLERLAKLLTAEERFTSEGKLLKNKVIESALKLDLQLIKLLLSDEIFTKHFFTTVEDITVFDKEKFLKFVSNKQFLPDSYTAFRNKIGLAVGDDKYFYENHDVVINFPYKDCVLVGGQDKEDSKRNEVFWNYTLAPEQVDTLLEPKVFTNVKKYTEGGEEEIEKIEETDNLIIKGNNLFALHSLKKRFAGRVKLIYIDPPYNTGSDSFNYNDSFNHSTWLTFMKNRLEVAKELLTKEGAIFVQCDDNEQAYLKVLMDEIFGNNNFINIITIKTKIGGVSGSTEGKSFKDSTEFINVFVKSKEQTYFNPVFQLTPLFDYISAYKEEGKSWKYTSIITKLEGKKKIKETEEYIFYGYESFESKSIKAFAKENNLPEEEVYIKYNDKIFRTTNAQSSVRQTVINETKEFDYPIVSIEYIPKKGKNKGKKTEILYKDRKRNMIMFLSDMITETDGIVYYKERLNTLWDDIQYNNLSKEGGISFPNGKKPEKLLKRIIELTTDEGDIVLDYHLGSGTTAAVAHKMNRHYIGIEQLDYGENDSVVRLQNVINGDQSGISQDINWKGGGNFVYMELFELNKRFDKAIEECEAKEDAKQIFEDILENAILDYTFDISKADKVRRFIEEEDLSNTKKLLFSLLDPNHMYLNYSEIDDETYKVSNKDKKINKSFYEED